MSIATVIRQFLSLSIFTNFIKRIVHHKLSFRTILIMAFVVQVIGAVGLTGYLSFQNGYDAVTHLARQLRYEVIAQVQQRLNTYLKYPLLINQANAKAIRQGYLNADLNVDDPQRDFYFWQQMQLFNAVSWIGLGTQAGGEYFSITRTPPNALENQPLQFAIASQATQYKLSYYAIDATTGQRGQLLEQYPPFNARLRPWYQAAVQAGKTTWHIYSGFFTPHLSYLSASQPIYDDRNQLLGVTSVDFDLNDLSLFLGQLKVSQQGQIFIVDQDGLMVASSTKENIFSYRQGTSQRLQAIDSKDPLIRITTRHLLATFNHLHSLYFIQDLDFVNNNQDFFLQIIPIADSFDLNWFIVVVMPKADFMAEINAQTRITFLLLWIALSIAIVIGLLTAHWIARPILKLNVAAKSLALGEWDSQVEIEREDEVGELTHSFNKMAAQLKTFYKRLVNDNITLELKVAERTHELSQALDDLKATQNQLIIQEKMASLGMLTAGIAHEIKNPLNFINNFAALSIEFAQELRDLLEAQQVHFNNTVYAEIKEILQDLQQNANSIYEEGQRADSIVQSMLFHSRSNGRQRYQTDINLLVKESIKLAYHCMRSNQDHFHVQIETECDNNLKPLLIMPQELSQVLINIISNAYYAMQEKQQTLDDTYTPRLLLQTQDQGEWVEIKIRDNGIGIPEDVRTQIFLPFFSTKPAGKGTGLGLSISYDIIVQGHQGQLEVETEVGQYTLFTIRLPKS